MNKVLLFFGIFITAYSYVFAQAIPEVIKSDLVLKGRPQPYVVNNITIEKNTTLTLMPGAKLQLDRVTAPGVFHSSLVIKGKLVVKGTPKAPAIITGLPVIISNSGEVDITGLEANCMTLRLYGETTGTIKDSKFYTDETGNNNYNFAFDVPQKGKLAIMNTHFLGRGVTLKTEGFPNDLANFTLTKCAFTNYLNKQGKVTLAFLPIQIFAYGDQCDTYIDIKFEAFNWELKKPLQTSWFIRDEHKRKTLEGSIKELKTFSMKLPAKAFTTFKQEEPPAAPDKKK